MPDVRNCKRCGKIYNYIGGTPLCPACRDEDEEDFKRVKEYLYSHHGASITEVSTALGVSIEKIRRFLKEGRLEIIESDGNFMLECEGCGKSIKTGRFCDVCEKELSKNFQTVAGQMNMALSDNDRKRRDIEMRYLNKNNKDRM